jgi:hypothetical protein
MISRGFTLVSSIPAAFAIFQTTTLLTPPICLATSEAFGLSLSAPMIWARWSAESRFPDSAAASVMPAALAILPTFLAHATDFPSNLFCVRVVLERTNDLRVLLR